MTISAHFDGKVIVPDAPLDLPRNQALILEIQPVAAESSADQDSALEWLAANAVDSATLPEDLSERHDEYLYRGSSKDDRP